MNTYELIGKRDINEKLVKLSLIDISGGECEIIIVKKENDHYHIGNYYNIVYSKSGENWFKRLEYNEEKNYH